QQAARAELGAALDADKWIVTSPAAVRFAQRLQPLTTTASVFALGTATAKALHRAGVHVIQMPHHADSEGVLALPTMQCVHGQRIAVIGAAGGRGLLQATLTERGARVAPVHVYRREPARLNRRHWQALKQLAVPPVILLSSAASLAALQAASPAWAWAILQAGIAVVSSERLDAAAAQAGFGRRIRARSALASDLLDALPNLRVTTDQDDS
ncbi:MAG: uroporphyrinogen-III synthase, partial [Xanthomonadales bacterium]|nr:uroporphyrinogen-III synthase [Xanthomonadales bacterium]